MKYIKIKNKGCIEPQALHLVGASTKTNDDTKIGQFGSGNKYALAYLLRNNYEVKIFSGGTEIKIETKKETFRDNEFEVIYIDGERTSITTQMGKDWKFWQAMREIYCNALDEGGCVMDFVQEIESKEDETHFYIQKKVESGTFVLNFDNYFAQNKKVLFECKYGRILEKSGTDCNIYRKGIRCYNSNKTSVYDYDFNDIHINENRLVEYHWEVQEKIWKIIYQCSDKELIINILNNSSDENYLEGCISSVATISSNVSEVFKETLNNINIAPQGFAGLLKPDELQNHVIIPTKVYKSIRGHIEDKNVGDKFKFNGSGGIFRTIDMSLLHQATLKEAMYFFSEVGFEIPYEVKCAIFDDKDILGTVDENIIIVSDICFDKGINEVVNTIIEEFIHIKYNVQDETRGFQTSIISELITYMKKINSFTL
jgi:hypothetical protein